MGNTRTSICLQFWWINDLSLCWSYFSGMRGLSAGFPPGRSYELAWIRLGWVSSRVLGLSSEKPEISSPQMPGMLFSGRNASPAKSFVNRKSWSITVNMTHAPRCIHCCTETQLWENEVAITNGDILECYQLSSQCPSYIYPDMVLDTALSHAEPSESVENVANLSAKLS